METLVRAREEFRGVSSHQPRPLRTAFIHDNGRVETLISIYEGDALPFLNPAPDQAMPEEPKEEPKKAPQKKEEKAPVPPASGKRTAILKRAPGTRAPKGKNPPVKVKKTPKTK